MKSIAAAIIFFAFTAAGAAAQAAPPAATPAPSSLVPTDDNWHYAITPYLWLPNINGNVIFQRTTILPNPPAGAKIVDVGVQVGPSDYLSQLNFAVLAAFEARRKNFSIFGDYMNLNLSSNTSQVRTITSPDGRVQIPVSSSSSTHVFSGVFTLALGVTVAASKAANLDIGAGVRNVNVRASADYTLAGPISAIPVSGSLGGNATLTDAIFAVRGRVRLGDRWYVPYYGDLGTGNSNSTWQYLLGVAYAGRTNDVILGDRHLGYNQNNGQLLQNVRFGGPFLALRIHW